MLVKFVHIKIKMQNKSLYNYLFVFIFIFISEIFSQGKIIGVVRDEKYFTPVKDAVVSLYSNNDSVKHSGINTDGTGFFAFNDLESGKYRIEIYCEGYAKYKIRNIQINDRRDDYIFDTIRLSTSQYKIDEIILKDEFSSVEVSENKKASDNEKTITYGEGKIIGTVRDARDYTPVKDAVVLLFNSNDSIKLAGTGTDGIGFFAFNNISFGKYRIEVSFIGYNVYKAKNIQLDNNNSIINLDSIKLSTGHYSTDEIVVEDEKPLMEFNDEKKVFNTEKLMTSKGGTALDVLKKIPMVDVDANDNISLRGSTNVRILIDNKPMKFSSLRQLPADAIKNVEIITNPSAKYEAEGVTGILNIVLKKNENRGLGYNGNFYSGLRDNKSYYSGIGMNLKSNKWSLFLNGGFGNYRYDAESSSRIDYFNPTSFYNSNSNGNGNNKYYYGGFGAEYELKKSHSVGFDMYFNKGNYENISVSNNYNYDSLHIFSSLYKNNNPYNGDWNNYSMNMYYNGKFDKLGKELNIDFTYSGNNNKYNSNQIINYYNASYNPVDISNQLNNTDNKSHNVNAQLDYTNPFNDKTKFETGYKGTFRSNDNDFTSDTLNYIYNIFFRNNGLTNHFKLDEYINAVYGTFSHKIANFRFKLGLRVEHTHTKGELITSGTDIKKDYIDYFPTISIGQKLGKANEIQLSYSRRITRPNIYRLNPFVQKSSSKFISYGNPELTPEYTNSFELNYMFISNLINITPILFYRKSTDIISNYNFVIDTNVTVTTYKNSLSGYTYGMDFIISSHALKWWNLNSTFSFYKAKYETDITNDYSGEEGFSWKVNIRSSFTIEKWFNIEVVYQYNGKKINASGYNIPSSSLDIAINKNFFDNKLNLGIRGEDLFKTTKWGGETNGIGVTKNNEYSFSSRGVYLNLSYTFGNSKDYYKKSKNTKKNENEKSDSSEEGNK